MRYIIVLCSLLVNLGFISCRSAQSAVASDASREVSDATSFRSVDTIRILSHSVDTVIARDSVFVFAKGDSIVIREYHFRDRTKLIAAEANAVSVRDTVSNHNENSTVIRTVEKHIKAKPPWWQNFLIWFGATCLIILFLKISAKLAPLIRKTR